MGFYDYTEFIVWQRANDVRRLVRGLTTRSVFNDHRWLRTQLRRAANSSCASIVEGYGKFYPREFARYLRSRKDRSKRSSITCRTSWGWGWLQRMRHRNPATRSTRVQGIVGLILYLESLPPERVRNCDDSANTRARRNRTEPQGTLGTSGNPREPR